MSSNEDNDFSSDDEDFVPNEADDSEHEDDENLVAENQNDCVEKSKEETKKMSEAKKIWESMKQESGSSTSKSSERNIKDHVLSKTQNQDSNESLTNSEDKVVPQKKNLNGSKTVNGNKTNDTIVITKVYDFAGEEVTVKKEVKRDSKEAISHMKDQSSSSKPPTTTLKQHQSPLSRIFNSSGLGKPVKRSGGIGNVLGKIGKKPKLSTLEKSKLDWNAFKEEKGIGNELLSYNKGKDGYLEKVSFLQRTDMRQYEHEKSLRLGKKS